MLPYGFLSVRGHVSAKRFLGCGCVFVAVAVELIWEEEWRKVLYSRVPTRFQDLLH